MSRCLYDVAPKKSGSSSKKAVNGMECCIDADEQLTFEEKKELCKTVQNLESRESGA
jgi:hypothetical protein